MWTSKDYLGIQIVIVVLAQLYQYYFFKKICYYIRWF